MSEEKKESQSRQHGEQEGQVLRQSRVARVLCSLGVDQAPQSAQRIQADAPSHHAIHVFVTHGWLMTFMSDASIVSRA